MPDFLKRLAAWRPDGAWRQAILDDRARIDRHDDEDEDDQEATAGIVERRYFEYAGGTSAKFYAVVLHGDEDEEWTVHVNFGRIGHPRDWATKVEYTDEDDARRVFEAIVEEKSQGGYGWRPWPASLRMPAGLRAETASDGAGEGGHTTYISAVTGTLPQAAGASVGGVRLPSGVLVGSGAREDGPPVIWISERPVPDVEVTWRQLATAFPATGLWPLVMRLDIEPDRMAEILFEPRVPGGRSARTVLSGWWSENLADHDDADTLEPFGERFPGLAPGTPGPRPTDVNDRIAGLTGHLGLVAVGRPADVPATTGWTGAANYDADPGDQSSVLRSWEDRFDAYLVGLGWDTMVLAVGRPVRDRDHATSIAAEHTAFCPDIIWQGAGTIQAYRDLLIDAPLWAFWWD